MIEKASQRYNVCRGTILYWVRREFENSTVVPTKFEKKSFKLQSKVDNAELHVNNSML